MKCVSFLRASLQTERVNLPTVPLEVADTNNDHDDVEGEVDEHDTNVSPAVSIVHAQSMVKVLTLLVGAVLACRGSIEVRDVTGGGLHELGSILSTGLTSRGVEDRVLVRLAGDRDIVELSGDKTLNHIVVRVEPVHPGRPELGHGSLGHHDTAEQVQGRENEGVQQSGNLGRGGEGSNCLTESNSEETEDDQHDPGVECQDRVRTKADCPVENQEENRAGQDDIGNFNQQNRRGKRFPAVVFAGKLSVEPLTF